MSYIQIQKKHGGGEKALPSVHVAESHWCKARRRSVQSREYLGRLDEDGFVIVSKGYPNRTGERIPLSMIKEMIKNGEDDCLVTIIKLLIICNNFLLFFIQFSFMKNCYKIRIGRPAL
jgi:hypothetical protein